MADEKSKVTDKASEIAKNIWLAGVGAYGKAVEDAQGRLEKVGMEPPKLFRELVKAGTALEDDAREALETTTAARHSVEERINRVRENFHMQRPARIEDLKALHKKVDQLTRKVDRLSKALAEQGAVKSAAGRKPAAAKKSAAAAPARTTTKKKAPAKKKTTARKKAPARTKATVSKRKR
jgi:polyhydroxyalkanoate synthesis regulator phasin